MVETRTLEFLQAPMQTTQEWLGEFMEHTGRKDDQKAWQMMRAVLHVLRDRLTVEQCAHLSAQIPLVMRGLYFEGWKPSEQPVKIRNREDFVQAVAEELSGHPEIDPQQAIDGTLRVLERRISAGELDKIKKQLPPELREFWPSG